MEHGNTCYVNAVLQCPLRVPVEMTTAANRKVTTPMSAMMVVTPTVRLERQRIAIENVGKLV
jgi:ubiquitin C-terminal hydrolase